MSGANSSHLNQTKTYLLRLSVCIGFMIHCPTLTGDFTHTRTLEQVIVAIDGACEFVLDDGNTREQVWLNRPDIGLYIGKNMWRETRHFSYGCKLMVLASEYYDEKEYIRDYQTFLESIKCQ